MILHHQFQSHIDKQQHRKTAKRGAMVMLNASQSTTSGHSLSSITVVGKFISSSMTTVEWFSTPLLATDDQIQ